MSGLSKIVSYELFTLEISGWTLHGRYPSAELDDVIADAKAIKTHQGHATKLVRETYYPDTNQSDDAVVRINPNLADYKRKLTRSQPRIGGGGGIIPNFGNTWDDGKPAEQMGTGRLLSRIAMMVVSALLIATGITGVLSLLLRSSVVAGHLSTSTTPQILFATFIAVFLLAALPLINRYIPSLASTKKPDDDASPAFLDMPSRKTTDAEKSTKPTNGPALFQNDPGLMEQPAAKPPEPKPEPEPETTVETENETAPDEIAAIEHQRMTMMRFLTGVLTTLKDSCPHLDAYNKLGLNLIMAGACAALGHRESLTSAQITAMTCELISMLGSKPSLAQSFCHNLETHIADPRYAAMYQKGGQALDDHLNGRGMPFDDIDTAMTSWNRPADRVSGSNIVTILFTDMVGSTLLTQHRGDTAAQDYIRSHNAIVRAALVQNQGVEIKHAGDGIMASFGAPSQALETAAAIQKTVRAHNAVAPQQEFHLRIGINSGEPIIEDDDMFGFAVQLASRICSEAEPDHVLIANVVRELVAGKSYPMQGVGSGLIKVRSRRGGVPR